MKYEDERYGFLLEIPNDWKEQNIVPDFILTGGRFACESRDKKANLNVSAGKLKEEFKDRLTRRVAAIRFLMNNPRFPFPNLNEVENFALDGEKNTVYFKYLGFVGPQKTKSFIYYSRDLYGRFLSSFHNEIEYVIQSSQLGNKYETTIDKIINSFKFRK